MYGCSQKVLNEVLEKPIKSDEIDIHFAGYNATKISRKKYSKIYSKSNRKKRGSKRNDKKNGFK